MSVRPVALSVALTLALHSAWPAAQADVFIFSGNLHSHTALSHGSGTPVVDMSGILTARDHIFPWRRIRRTRAPLSRQSRGQLSQSHRLAAYTIATSDAPPKHTHDEYGPQSVGQASSSAGKSMPAVGRLVYSLLGNRFHFPP